MAINVNTIAEDRLPKMKERAEAKGFDFPYLYDDTQKIGKAFGAAFTPEFFVLNRKRQVVYMGGMDDSSNAGQVKNNYLEPAVEAALAGTAARNGRSPGDRLPGALRPRAARGGEDRALHGVSPRRNCCREPVTPAAGSRSASGFSRYPRFPASTRNLSQVFLDM